jgi:8-oxo-dGTP pyrophosphatase MutT (NUDIX family)
VPDRRRICWDGVVRIDVIDHADAEHPARPAATLVMLRDGADELEVLMIERGSATSFGGMWAFPGGVVEDEDIPSGTEPDPMPAARIAAVRETEEETGFVVDPAHLVWWSHWLPPGRGSLSTKRFSTWFFVVAVEADADAVVVPADPDPDAEVVSARWIAPAVALALQERGDILLAPPTYVTLSQLVRYGDVDTAVAAADPCYFATEVAFDGDTRLCIWEGDVAYGGGDHRADGSRHRLAMDDVRGWRYLKSSA